MTEAEHETNCVLYFDGRLDKKKYLIINISVLLITSLIFYISYLSSLVVNFIPHAVICFFWYCMMFWVLTAAQIKRLHDRNKSGWWLLILYFCNFLILGIILYIAHLREEQMPYLHLLPTLLIPMIGHGWFIIETFFLQGVKWENEYGPNPLYRE